MGIAKRPDNPDNIGIRQNTVRDNGAGKKSMSTVTAFAFNASNS